jgi:hypothetical protein
MSATHAYYNQKSRTIHALGISAFGDVGDVA